MTALDHLATEAPKPEAERLSFLPIDPFAAHAHVASRIAGLGGAAAEATGYVFETLDIYPVTGPIRFTLQFHGLRATRGTLRVTVRALAAHPALPPCPAPMPLHEVTVPLATLAADGGVLHVELVGRHNMGCTVSGTIDDDTDAAAEALSLSLDPRARDAPPLPDAPVALTAPPAITAAPAEHAGRPELAVIGAPQLARPVSQGMTAAQAGDPLVAGWNAVLRADGGDPAARWGNAMILQALRHYGVGLDGLRALGIMPRRHPLPCYVAARGGTVLVAATRHDQLGADPGATLERWHYPELCSARRHSESVYLTLFEELALPAPRAEMDAIWSIDAWEAAPARVAPMVRGAMSWLRPGGVAVHLLPYAGTLDAPADARGLGRVEIERIALTLVADGHEVAQLDFALDPVPARVTPFALIARRQR